MRAEEFESLTDQQLQEKANACFITADTLNINLGHNYSEKVRHLLEAQFYLTHAIRKRVEQRAEREKEHNRKIEKRDFRMEVGVMVLIGIEIVLSLYGLKEGRDQAAVMNSMATSATLTATYMTEATRDLHELNDAQADSLKILKRQ